MINFLIILITIFKAQAFTLNNNVNLAFSTLPIKVNVADTFCDNIGISEEELLSIANDAVIEYWNKAPTSKLKIEKGSLKNVSANFKTGLICQSGTNCTPNSALQVSSDILISCNQNATNFGSSAVLAMTVPNNLNGNTINGALILINDNSSTNYFSQKSRDEKVAIIAHEIGHAIGLGHSPVRDSLMYYQTVPNRRSLGQDDLDGVTYLYPKSQPVSCGTIEDINHHPANFILTALLGFIITYLVYLKLRPRLSHSLS